MSQLDVTDLLLDPDVAGETFDVLRREQILNGFGRYELGVTVVAGVRGAVFPSGDNSLAREEAYQKQEKSLTVVTQYRLRGEAQESGGQQYQPDVVRWRGSHFLVRSVSDFSRYGAGFVEAECVSTTFVDPPPGEAPPRIGKVDFSSSTNSGLA